MFEEQRATETGFKSVEFPKMIYELKHWEGKITMEGLGRTSRTLLEVCPAGCVCIHICCSSYQEQEPQQAEQYSETQSGALVRERE